jgi:hypothetical protein
MTDASIDPLCNWRELTAPQRQQWWQELWLNTLALTDRYRLALRSGWWEDTLQVEALAAFSAWIALYDTAGYSDPPGKIQLLWELERLKTVLRAGERAFDPARDRPAYERHLTAIGCHPSKQTTLAADSTSHQELDGHRQTLNAELAQLLERLHELAEREQLLRSTLKTDPKGRDPGAAHAQQDLTELTRTIAQLRRRRRELRCQLDETRQS